MPDDIPIPTLGRIVHVSSRGQRMVALVTNTPSGLHDVNVAAFPDTPINGHTLLSLQRVRYSTEPRHWPPNITEPYWCWPPRV